MKRRLFLFIVVFSYLTACSLEQPDALPEFGDSCKNAAYVLINGEKCIDDTCHFNDVVRFGKCLSDNPVCESALGDLRFCRPACAEGHVFCIDKCVDPLTDSKYCGADSKCLGYTSCAEDSSCQKGICVAKSEIYCDGKWVDPLSDPKYCGSDENCAGGEVCGENQVCSAGKCRDYGTILCNGEWIDPQTDQRYCGAGIDCSGGSECRDNEKCLNGRCLVEGKIKCGGEWIDPKSDRRYCGADSHCEGAAVCLDNQTCRNGTCIEKGRVQCNGAWIDPLTNDEYCGANESCGGYASCAADREKCRNGICVPKTDTEDEKYTDCGGVSCVKGHCVNDVCDRKCDDYPEECGMSAERCDDMEICHSDPACNGIGKCTAYVCGDAETCQWDVCKEDKACRESVCDPAALSPDGDWDGDGIINSIEIASDILDPCKVDTDGDGFFDKDEDRNGDGIYQKESGESDPSDPKSIPANTDPVLYRAICIRDELLESGRTLGLTRFNMAFPLNFAETAYLEPRGCKIGENDEGAEYDDPEGISIFFAPSEDNLSGKEILKRAFYSTKNIITRYSEAAVFDSAVPLARWKENKNYNFGFQIAPDHEITHYTYDVELSQGSTLESFRNLISESIMPDISARAPGKTICKDGRVIFKMSRSTYSDTEKGKKYSVYSGAAACADRADADRVVNYLSEITSGTLVTPKNIYGSKDGYLAYNGSMMCEFLHPEFDVPKVDFIWVIDNTETMAGKLDALSKSAADLMNRLKKAGIDYRMGVSGTDAYLLDEWNDVYDNKADAGSPYFPFKQDTGERVYANPDSYYGYTGLRPFGTAKDRETSGQCMVGPSASESLLASAIAENAQCTENNKNICGRQFEDGLKSGLTVLQRLKLDASGPVSDYVDQIEKKRKSNWAFGRQSTDDDAFCAGGLNDGNNAARCKKIYNSCASDDEALQYIIWVTDEESRQFKEQPEISKQGAPIEITDAMLNPFDADAVQTAVGDAVVSAAGDKTEHDLVGCLTGYKLENYTNDSDRDSADLLKLVYNMKNGAWIDTYPFKDCNVPLAMKLKELIKAGKITDESPLEEIRKAFPEYYDMIMYYIKSYWSNAGKQGIAGFALVGDSGYENGGNCRPLEKSDDGAEYGLSYIHMSKYMGRLIPGAGLEGQGGGHGSICSHSYKHSMDEIFRDVTARRSMYQLNGYPIVSSIRVSLLRSGEDKAVDLKRGIDWRYDAIQNSIVFFDGKIFNDNDKFGISYVMWNKI